MAEKDIQIDSKYMDKQSRTIGTYGLETMAKLISFKVLIVGCGGVGVEIAKNLALAGIHTIHLFDTRKATNRDMGVNFAITNETVKAGMTMAEASAAYIAALNPNTRVRVATELNEAAVKLNTAVIFTSAALDLSLKTLVWWNHFCRTQSPVISFFLALQCGAIGSVFADHGNDFTVHDCDGLPKLQKSITEIVTRTDKAGDKYSRIRFETPEGQTPGALRDYTQIKFTEVVGLVKPDGTSANNMEFNGVVCPTDPKNIVRIYPSLEEQGFSKYGTGGFIHELKEVMHLKFRPLAEALHSPGTFVPVSPMMDNSDESQVHISINALLRYADTHDGALPKLHNDADADAVVECARVIAGENKVLPVPAAPEGTATGAPTKEEFAFHMPPPPPPAPLVFEGDLDEAAIKRAALIASAELQPLAAFFGAVVAQEVVKITGKYSPIHQWFHLSCEAVVPENANYATDADFAPTGSRYDDLIAVLGKNFHNKLQSLRIFMVGCGALGCENVKNFALCGITCGKTGSFVITDNDRIEVSNLSRQFLFREDNVGQFKSAAAGARMRQMNRDVTVDARQDFVGATTEHLFPDTFWSDVDVVVNALDNMEARLYVDGQCVRFHKILLEAGTMGTSGNVDIIVPGKTSSYADGGAADQTGGIPMCTLRNFPYIYDHCIEWSRALFDDLFVSPMQAVHQIIEDPEAFAARISNEVAGAKSTGEKRSLIEKNLGPLKQLKGTLRILADGPDMNKCVKMAWDCVFQMFRDRIYDLQKAFPKDAKKKNEEPFWSGHRKYPHSLEVDASNITANEDVANFLIAAVSLYACMFGVHPPKHEARFNDENNRWMNQYRSVDWLKDAVKGFSIPEYVPGAVDNLDEDLAADAVDASKGSEADAEKELQVLLSDVSALAVSCQSTKAAPLEFEKDDDDNFQIDFVAATSNLRAENYLIPTADRMKVKLVAGKIIPAIATTTSAVTGLALIELFKVLQGKDVSTLRNGMLNIGTNNYVLFERDLPIRNRTRIVSTYIPEQDYTYKKKLNCIPEGFTKYDSIDVTITPTTTVQQFSDNLVEKLITMRPAGASYSFEVYGLGVGKGLIWSGSPKHAHTNLSLMDVIEKQKVAEAGGTLSRPFWENRTKFFDISASFGCDDDDDSADEVDVETAIIKITIQQ